MKLKILSVLTFTLSLITTQAHGNSTPDISKLPAFLDGHQVIEKWDMYYTPFFTDNYIQRWRTFYKSNEKPKLSHFTSDGCSSFPDGTVDFPRLWRDCCIIHDLSYWRGGPWYLKTKADEDLKQCVKQKVSTKYEEDSFSRATLEAMADVMKFGVAIGGLPFEYKPWRWGYGWHVFMKPEKLTQEEAQEVAERLKEYESVLRTGHPKEFTPFGLPVDRTSVLEAVRN